MEKISKRRKSFHAENQEITAKELLEKVLEGKSHYANRQQQLIQEFNRLSNEKLYWYKNKRKSQEFSEQKKEQAKEIKQIQQKIIRLNKLQEKLIKIQTDFTEKDQNYCEINSIKHKRLALITRNNHPKDIKTPNSGKSIKFDLNQRLYNEFRLNWSDTEGKVKESRSYSGQQIFNMQIQWQSEISKIRAQRFLTLIQDRGKLFKIFQTLLTEYSNEEFYERFWQVIGNDLVLQYEFNQILPRNQRKKLPNIRMRLVERFFKQLRMSVRQQLTDQDTYDQIIKLIIKYQKDKINFDEFNYQMINYIGSFKNILHIYYSIIPFHEFQRVYQRKEQIYNPMKLQSVDPNDTAQFFAQIKTLLDSNSAAGTNLFKELIYCLELYFNCVIIHSEFCYMVRPLFKLRNMPDYILVDNIKKSTSEVLENFKTQLSSQLCRISNYRKKYGYFFKPLCCECIYCKTKIGASYYKLNRPIIQGENRQTEIINGQFLNIPQWKEDKILRSKIGNWEQLMFDIEDEKHHFDWIVKLFISAVENLEKILLMTDNQRQEIQKFIKGARRSAITYLYQDYSELIFQLLLNQPNEAIPVIVQRIRLKLKYLQQDLIPQKEMEWNSLQQRQNNRKFTKQKKQKQKEMIKTDYIPQKWLKMRLLPAQIKLNKEKYKFFRVNNRYVFKKASEYVVFRSQVAIQDSIKEAITKSSAKLNSKLLI